MGNFIQNTRSNYLLAPVSPQLEPLTKCKNHVGTSNSILKIQQKVAKMDLLHGIYIDPHQLKPIFKQTDLEGCEIIVLNNFLNNSTKKVNIMEVLASLITYSAAAWDEKVRLALDIFDFDENHVITYDEMATMCKSFINGIGIMTQSALYSKAVLEGLSDQAFVMADSTPDGRVTCEELLDWIRSNEVLLALFQTNQPQISRRRDRSGSLIESMGLEVVSKGPNANFAGRRPTVRRKTEYKKAEYKKNSDSDEILIAIQQIFAKHGNYKGKLSVKDFYQHLEDSEVLAHKRKRLITALNLRLTAEVNFEEINKLIKGLSSEKKHQLYSEDSQNEIPVGSTNRDIEVLKALFDSYDLNKDSKLSLKELTKGLKDKFSEQTIKEMFSEYDLDGNGALDFEEFVRLYSPDEFILPKTE